MSFGIGAMTCRCDERGELGDRDRRCRDREAVDADLADRAFPVIGIGQRILAAHEEAAAGQADHCQILRSQGRELGQQLTLDSGRSGRFPARHSHLGAGFFSLNTHLGGRSLSLARSDGRVPCRAAA